MDQPGDEARLYALYCDDEYRGLVWLSPNDFAPAPTAPVVEQLVRRIETMPASVDVRPDGRGVTGIPSLFWVDGYDGAPISESLSAFGVTVQVQATMTDAVWDFGDGTPAVHGGLGEAWPQRSSVRHTYANPSPAGGYPVTVTVALQPTFSVDGGPATQLAPIVSRTPSDSCSRSPTDSPLIASALGLVSGIASRERSRGALWSVSPSIQFM